ncbi:MAG TPA: antibiotic biosynthesis monooxygenase family protein [Thermoanaerobaculia bacterium]|nr:antibiotic biosynthesis monooxygenase family protein [Thermoanaerobaculia bacterium]
MTIVWKFRIRAGAREEFERHYGPSGTWVQLFRSSRGYLGTELYRSVADDREYLTIDHWVDEAAFRAFRDKHGDAYAALDAQCEALTETEEKIS